MSESFGDGTDASPTEQADSQYLRGETLGPFPGGLLDPVNGHLGLVGRDRAKGTRHAFDLLMAGTRGTRIEKMVNAVNVLSEVEGLEQLRLPQDLGDTLVEQAAQEAEALAEEEFFARRQQEEVYTPDDDSPFEVTETLEQGGVRGYVNRTRGSVRTTFNIFLTEHADFSTFLHESAHIYLEMMKDLAQHPKAKERIKTDYQTVLKFVGAQEGVVLTREQEETFSRSFEAYFLEGKSPSVKLPEPFAVFRSWLTSVYDTVKSLRVELTDDIRSVFDRALASDLEIQRNSDAQGLDNAMFRTHIDAGMTPQEFEAYSVERRRITNHATIRAAQNIAKARLKAAKFLRSQEMDKFREQAKRARDQRNDVRAWRYVRFGERIREDGTVLKDNLFGKMSRPLLQAVAGEDSSIEQKLKGRLLAKNGEHPEQVAEQFGFEDSRAMLDALDDIPDADGERIELEADAERMLRDARPEIDEEISTLQLRIQEAFHGAGTLKRYLTERKALAKNSRSLKALLKDRTTFALRADTEVELPPAAAFRLAARDVVGRLAARRISLGQALATERSLASNEAIEAAKGNYNGALFYNQRKILQYHIWKEMLQASKDRSQFLKVLKKLGRDKFRKRLAVGGNALLTVGDTLVQQMNRADVRVDRSEEHNQTFDRSLNTIAVAGSGLSFDDQDLIGVINRVTGEGWRSLNIKDMRLVRDAMFEVDTLARDATSIAVEGKRLEIRELTQQIEKDTKHRPKRDLTNENVGLVEGLLSNLLEGEEIIRRLGPRAYKVVFEDGYIASRERRRELLEKVGDFFARSWDRLPKELQEKRFNKVENLKGVEWPTDIDYVPVFDRQWMWMIALNMGNTSNSERLTGGFGWNEKEVLGWLNSEMSEAEWGFVESIWKLLDKELFPHVAQAFKEEHGILPQKIQATVIETPFGPVSGGYFPARYHPVAARNKRNLAEAKDNAHRNAGSLSVLKSFTKPRADSFSDVLNLDWNVVPAHVMAVTHYAAFNTFVRQARSLFLDEEFQRIAKERVGVANYNQLVEERAGWLSDIANTVSDAIPRNLRPIYDMFGIGKRMLVNMGIGWSVKTALADQVDPLRRLLADKRSRIRGDYLAKSYAKAYSVIAWSSMRERALRKSSELKSLKRTGVHVAISDIQRIGQRTQFVRNQRIDKAIVQAKEISELAFVFLDTSSKISSTIVWDATYRQAIDTGVSDKEAAKLADRNVRRSIPVSDPSLKPAILRDRRLGRLLLVFFGYFSKAYNDVAPLIDDALINSGWMGKNSEKALAGLTLAGKAGMALAMLGVGQTLGEVVMGHGPEEDEGTDEWIVRKMIAAPFSIFPFVSGFSESLAAKVAAAIFDTEVRGHMVSERGAPAVSALFRLWNKMNKILEEDPESTLDVTLDALEIAGLIAVMPFGTAQFSRIRSYLQGKEEGRVEEDLANFNILGLLAGAIYGERAGQAADPYTFADRLINQ